MENTLKIYEYGTPRSKKEVLKVLNSYMEKQAIILKC